MEPSLIFFLAIFTLGAGLAFGGWQLRRVKKAQRNNESTALDQVNPASRAPST